MRTLALSALLLCSFSAQAATIPARWQGSTVTMNMNTWMSIFSQNAATAMQDVASDVYFNASNFAWVLQWDDDASYATDNGESETTVTTDNALLCGVGSDGCCYAWLDAAGTYIDEADVYMNASATWSYTDVRAGTWGYGGNARPFKTAFLHELGHAAGLSHNSGVYNIMGQDYTHVYVDSTNAYEYLGEDATYGLRSTYGTYGGEDLGVSHWKYSYANGAYSWHTRTNVTSSTGAALATVANGTETAYKVNKGATVRFEHTIENNGSNTKTPTFHFYLSSDANITSADTLLTSYSATFSPDTPSTTYKSVTLPARLTSGNYYYLGVIVDQANSIAEINEGNNSTWTMIKVN